MDKNIRDNFKKDLYSLLYKYNAMIGVDSNLSLEENYFNNLAIVFVDIESNEDDNILYKSEDFTLSANEIQNDKYFTKK